MCDKCRFCCLGRSTSVVIAAVFTLIQSAFWFTGALFFVLSHQCNYSLDAWPWLYGLYLTYLRNPACGEVDLTKLGITNPTVQPIFVDGILDQVSRTNIFAWLYVGFNGWWFISSLLLLFGATQSCSGKCAHHFTWQPWLWSTLSNIVLDIVATIFYGIDVQNADTWPNLLSWIGVTNPAEVSLLFSTDTPTELPVLTMLAYTCRFAIIEVINIYLLLLVTYIYFEILSEFIDDGPTRFDYERHKAMVNRAFEQDDDPLEPTQNGNHFRLDTHLKQATLIRSPNNNHERTNGNAARPYNRSVSEIQPNSNEDLDESVERRLKNYQVVGLSALSPSSDKTKPDYQIREPRRDVNRNQTNGVELRPKSVHPVPVVAPPPRVPEPDYDDHPRGSIVANIRESLQRAAERSSSIEREVHLLNHVPEPNADSQVGRSSSFQTNRPELRNQLPWSYFKAEESTAPKRSFVNPITGQPVNLDRSTSKSPTPIAEQNGEYEERTVI